MFELLNLFVAGINLLSNITLYADDSFNYPKDREAVVAVQSSREWWREGGSRECRYTGIMVPFVRDWSETKQEHGTPVIVPPMPDVTVGHAVLFNQKLCKDKPAETIFRVGATSGANFFMRLPEGASVQSYDFNEMRAEHIPPWLGQSLSRVARVASTDPVARKFMEQSAKDLQAAAVRITAAMPAPEPK